jgi:hypothetical protein
VSERSTPYLHLHREGSTSIIEVNKEKPKIQWVCERGTPYLHLYREVSTIITEVNKEKPKIEWVRERGTPYLHLLIWRIGQTQESYVISLTAVVRWSVSDFFELSLPCPSPINALHSFHLHHDGRSITTAKQPFIICNSTN